MNGIENVADWHFLRQGNLRPDIQASLMPNEQVYAVYQTVRDQAVLFRHPVPSVIVPTLPSHKNREN